MKTLLNEIEKLFIARPFICEFCGLSTPCGYVLNTGSDLYTVCTSCVDTFEFTKKYVANSIAPDITLGLTIAAITG